MQIEQIHAAVLAAESSLNKHYWTLFSIAYGLQAKSVFEFGAGGSTAVLLAALDLTGGKLISCDLERLQDLVIRIPSLRDVAGSSRWEFHNQHSQHVLKNLGNQAFDLVLHDGSHEPDQVAEDIAGILPHLKQFGLLLVHDVEQFALGEEMRRGLMEGIRRSGRRVSMTSLPYSDGLAIVRMEDACVAGRIQTTWSKATTRPATPAAIPW